MIKQLSASSVSGLSPWDSLFWAFCQWPSTSERGCEGRADSTHRLFPKSFFYGPCNDPPVGNIHPSHCRWKMALLVVDTLVLRLAGGSSQGMENTHCTMQLHRHTYIHYVQVEKCLPFHTPSIYALTFIEKVVEGLWHVLEMERLKGVFLYTFYLKSKCSVDFKA